MKTLIKVLFLYACIVIMFAVPSNNFTELRGSISDGAEFLLKGMFYFVFPCIILFGWYLSTNRSKYMVK